MVGEDAAFFIDEDRDVEPERRDAVGDAGDLAGGMNARVAGIGRQRLDRQPAHRNARGRLIPIGHEVLALYGFESGSQVRFHQRSFRLSEFPLLVKNENRTDMQLLC